MIKINLAKEFQPKKKGLFGGGGADLAPIATEEIDDGMADLKRDLIVRLAILLGGSVFLFIYQEQNIPPLNSQLVSINSQLNEVRIKNQQAADAVSEIKKFEKDEEKLRAQLKAIEVLTKDRLKEVKVLDYIQREIPAKVWLSKLALNNSRLQIEGYASADADLTNFMEVLQGSAYLRDVSLVKSSEANLPEAGVVRKFEVTTQLERSE